MHSYFCATAAISGIFPLTQTETLSGPLKSLAAHYIVELPSPPLTPYPHLPTLGLLLSFYIPKVQQRPRIPLLPTLLSHTILKASYLQELPLSSPSKIRAKSPVGFLQQIPKRWLHSADTRRVQTSLQCLKVGALE